MVLAFGYSNCFIYSYCLPSRNLFAKYIGRYTNDVIWGNILHKIGEKTGYIDKDIHKAATDSLSEKEATIERYNKTINDLEAKNASQTLLITAAQGERDAANQSIKDHKVDRNNRINELKNKLAENERGEKEQANKNTNLASAIRQLVKYSTVFGAKQNVEGKVMLKAAINLLENSDSELLDNEIIKLKNFVNK